MKAGYWLTIKRDGETFRQQTLEDPFHTTTVTIGISRWDLLRALISRRQYETTVGVSLNASVPVINAVMNLQVEHPGAGQEVLYDASGQAQGT